MSLISMCDEVVKQIPFFWVQIPFYILILYYIFNLNDVFNFNWLSLRMGVKGEIIQSSVNVGVGLK
jgi:hypothetical protein